MATITVTNPNLSGTDSNSPSFLDVEISGSGLLPDGKVDGYCLQPWLEIDVSKTYRSTTVESGLDVDAYVAAGVVDDDSPFAAPSQGQVNEVNWILAQGYTDSVDPPYTYGQVQVAIWMTLGYEMTDEYPSPGSGVTLLEAAWSLLTDDSPSYSPDNAKAFMDKVNALLVELEGAKAEAGGALALADTLPDGFKTILLDPDDSAQPIIVPLGSIGDNVFEDTNGNGVQDVGESGVAGVTVNLYYCNADGSTGAQVTHGDGTPYTTTTDPDGNYIFEGLPPGDYKVEFVAPDGYTFTKQSSVAPGDVNGDSDADAGGLTGCVKLASGEVEKDVDAGLVRAASIGDTVWEDTDGDGIQDAGETGIPNAGVELYTCVTDPLTGEKVAGALVDSTTTADGTGADPAGYYNFANLQPGDYIVKFITPTGYEQTSVNVGADDAIDSDAGAGGFTGCYTLNSGDNNDTIDAGFYQPASLGDYVWVDTNGDGTQDDGNTGLNGVTVNLKDGTGTVIQTTTTANDGSGNPGYYLFDGLRPGDYSVEFVAPTGYTFTTQDQGGNDALDSDANAAGQTVTTTLVSGENDLSWDAGLVQLASIGDTVWEDTDGDGIQDAGETGIPNASVELYTCVDDGSGNKVPGTLVATTTTADGTGVDPVGYYNFANLQPGDYIVKFITPTGYEQTSVNVGADDAIDSDAGAGGFTGCYTLNSGDNNDTVDAGFYQPASLGDYVWVDTNGDGTQDDGNTGLNGVTVNLKDGTGAVIQTTTTANDGSGNPGYYLFDNLSPGDYSVEFVAPAGYTFTTQDQGGNDALDSDANAAGQTIQTTLTSGENDLSWDAGLIPNGSIDIEKFVHIESPGDFYSGPVCDDFGKAIALTFEYDESSMVDTSQSADKAQIIDDIRLDDDGTSYVIVTNKGNPFDDKADFYFSGEVNVGDTFVATAANAGMDNFKAETYFFYFDDNPFDSEGTNDLLQSAKYHTSCSQPIFLGDVIGDSTLVGYAGKDGVAPSTAPSIGPDFDADLPGSGPSAEIGDTAVFTYEVTNNGASDLDMVTVTDDRLDSLTLVDKGDGDDILSVGETWVYTASETVDTFGDNANIGTVSAEVVGTDIPVSDSDAAHYSVGGAAAGIDVEKYVSGMTPGDGKDSGDSGKDSGDSGKDSGDSGKDSGDSGKDSGDSGMDSGDSGKDSGDSGKDSGDSGKDSGDSGKDSGDSGMDSGDSGKDSGDSGMDSDDSGKDSGDSGKDSGDSGKDSGDSGKDSGDSGKDSDDSGKDSGDSGKDSGDSGKDSGDSGKDSGDSGKDSGDSGKSGSGDACSLSETGDLDADDSDSAPDLAVGTEAVYTYVVTNTGNVALAVDLTDDRIGDLTFEGGDTDEDGLLDVDEVWTFTASETVVEGEVVNTAVVTGTDAVTGLSATDADDAYYNGVVCDTAPGDSGDSAGGRDSGDSGKDSGDSGKDSGDSGKDSGDSGKDSGDSGKDSGDPSKDSGDSGKDSGDSGKDSGDPSKDSGDSGKDSGDSGKDSGDSGDSDDSGDWSDDDCVDLSKIDDVAAACSSDSGSADTGDWNWSTGNDSGDGQSWADCGYSDADWNDGDIDDGHAEVDQLGGTDDDGSWHC